jgi:hypothetical protein
MKKTLLTFLAAVLMGITTFAASPRPDEGMWLPMFVDRLNWTDIQEMGLQLTAEELYSINNSSLKDAIVGLAGGSAPGGYFCTGEMVSDQGLLFTNHHCGYDIIQNHSTIEHDYLTDGFWAMNLNEELSNANLTASFLVRMEDINSQILPQLSDTMNGSQRAAKVRELTKDIKAEASEDGKYDVVVKSFFGGNEYYMFVYQTFKDVRLVGAPPSSIGKFGGDTDNWMWPRHTGDFSIFRVYCAPDGSPAEYSESNVPFKPRHHLPVSLKGYQKDNYAMIWGYPGGTDRYMTSYGVEYALEEMNPTIINLFGASLDVMKSYMDADDAMRIKYASDYAGMANTWKYMIGQTRGLKRLDVKSKKQETEKQFAKWVNQDPQRKEKYGSVLENIQGGYKQLNGVVSPFYYAAIGSHSVDLLSMAAMAGQMAPMLDDAKENKTAIAETAKSLKPEVEDFFAEYDRAMDKDMMTALLKLYQKNIPANQLPSMFVTINKDFGGNIDTYVDAMFEKSLFANEASFMKFLDKPKKKTLEKDLAYQASQSLQQAMMDKRADFMSGQSSVDDGMRLFIDGLRQMNPGTKYYPDANSSMRFTYGTIEDYYPADAIHFDFQTHLGGVMEKEDPSNDEFIVADKLKQLYEAKDFGQYGENGRLPVAFLSTNDITGGNSGSPVMNGNGELIGIAFDGNWEAMSGDIAFEPELQRTISVDIRYVLFVIDKYAGAKNLIDELTIVR